MNENSESLSDEDLVRGVLGQLSKITKQVEADDNFKKEIASQLKDIGYDCFGGRSKGAFEAKGDIFDGKRSPIEGKRSPVDGKRDGMEGTPYLTEAKRDQIEASHVVKILSVAVNNALVQKVEIVRNEADDGLLDETAVTKEKLEGLLEIEEGKSIDDYLTKGWTDSLAIAKSPLDLARHVKKSAPLWFVKNLLKRQFDIKWDTANGEPRDFSYYEFCEEQGTTKHLKYKARKAQVNVQLYKECRKQSPSQLKLSEEDLCPPLFLKTTEGWQSWNAKGGKLEQIKPNEKFSWISEPIRNFILDHADEVRNISDASQIVKNEGSLDCLDRPALYWAVVREDLNVKPGESSQFKEIGKTQVYVGTAEFGIRGHWLDDIGSHCELMKKCVENIQAMTTYDPLRMKGVNLVDVRMALAMVRGDNCAVFLMKTYGDDIEKALIAKDKAVTACTEANSEWKRAKKTYAEIMDKLKKIEQSQEGERTKELRRVKKMETKARDLLESTSDALKNAKQAVVNAEGVLDGTSDLTDDEVMDQLKSAEARHKEGKRCDCATNVNIIAMHDGDQRSPWKPKNMAFGMNKY